MALVSLCLGSWGRGSAEGWNSFCGKGLGGGVRGNQNICWVPAFCIKSLSLPSVLRRWCYALCYRKELAAWRTGGAGIQKRWFLAQLGLGGEIRTSPPSSARPCGLGLGSLFFHGTVAWGPHRWPRCSFQSNPHLAGSYWGNLCQFPHFKGGGRGHGGIRHLYWIIFSVGLACLPWGWSESSLGHHFACCPLREPEFSAARISGPEAVGFRVTA